MPSLTCTSGSSRGKLQISLLTGLIFDLQICRSLVWCQRATRDKEQRRTGWFTVHHQRSGHSWPRTYSWVTYFLSFTCTPMNTHTQMCLDPNDMMLARTLLRPHEERWKERDRGKERGRHTTLNRGIVWNDVQQLGGSGEAGIGKVTVY